MVTFKINVTENGDIILRLPEGKAQQVDASKVSGLTEALAKALGTVAERHVGHEHGHVQVQPGNRLEV